MVGILDSSIPLKPCIHASYPNDCHSLLYASSSGYSGLMDTYSEIYSGTKVTNFGDTCAKRHESNPEVIGDALGSLLWCGDSGRYRGGGAEPAVGASLAPSARCVSVPTRHAPMRPCNTPVVCHAKMSSR